MIRKRSPGPWRFGEGRLSGYIVDANGSIVAGGEPHEGWMDKDGPDEILMCAAPELLEALRGVLNECIGPNEDPATWSEDSQVRKVLELLARLDK